MLSMLVLTEHLLRVKPFHALSYLMISKETFRNTKPTKLGEIQLRLILFLIHLSYLLCIYSCIYSPSYIPRSLLDAEAVLGSDGEHVSWFSSAGHWHMYQQVTHCSPPPLLLGHVGRARSVDWSPPGSSVLGLLQAGILGWVAAPSSRGSAPPRRRTLVSCVAGRLFTIEPPGKPVCLTLDCT